MKGDTEYPIVPGLISGWNKPEEYGGWFFWSFPKEGQRFYRAFCSKHSAAAFTWRDADISWHRRLREARDAQKNSIIHKLEKWGRKKFGLRMKGYMEDWYKKNPKPAPPWPVTERD